MKILIICTGNSCRSQMAEGFLRAFDASLVLRSAGTVPAETVNPFAVRVMSETGIDISAQSPDNIDKYANEDFDYVITVCDNAREACPVFSGNVRHRLHIGFEDPADARGTDEEVLAVYRKVRDEIHQKFSLFYKGIK